MIEIYFEQINDAEKFAHLLNEIADPFFCCEHNGDCLVTIYIHEQADYVISACIAPAIKKFILRFVEDRLLLSIISGTFYFKDKEEQQQILQLAHSFLEGERYDYRKGKQPVGSRETLIMNAVVSFLKDGLSFSIGSFVTFRLKAYIERLHHYVELAIDEYKLEQEYQNFVQMLRDYVAEREANWPVVHLVHRSPDFLFFDEQFRQVTNQELKQWIDRNLSVSQPMYIDSSVLAPLVSIAPHTIYLYTEHADDGMVQTIQNVFQERLRFCQLSDFAKYETIASMGEPST
ncbi:putative sporulation protein YtxC [Anoxybacillus tepidamans]|uniref:Putative sporulation protein YtxC n=1 Tax=Anoxybacteroides tepidamans TaxID=265948 RepID=A0A7W8IQ29_9BACL|nr:putative sporulation protein YtxC [Anoxybacillus tepidamans]MBB5324527.1 putative sporulation protein YtxC [Anoxybacillus tepidamans]